MANQISEYINKLSKNKKVQELLISILGKIFLQQDNLDLFIRENHNKIIHIRDWIASVVENKEEWKQPRVLTLEALNNVANKYFEKQNNKLQKIELNKTHEKLIADLGNYYIVQMLTPQALDNESKVMQHCIGHGYYDKNLNDKNYKYLSLRDKFNKAHATLEIENKKILQLQGKQNKLPDKKYLYVLFEWLISKKYNINLRKYNLVMNKKDNKIYSIFNLPNNCIIDDDLDLTDNIPSGLIVNGCLTLYNIKKIPENITSKSLDLNLNNSDITELPKSLKVKTIYMYGIKFEWSSIPDYLFVNNKIKINDLLSYLISEQKIKINLNNYDLVFNKKDNKVYSIYEIPKDLETIDDLDFTSIEIKNLPDNLIVNGDLRLVDCNLLTELPKKLIVKGTFEISYCQNINHLPNGLIVENDLSLEQSNITELPTDIKIGESLFLNNSKIECLPDNLTINGDLDVYVCNNLKKLPNNLSIKGDLNLGRTNIKEIPENIKIEKSLYLYESEIEKLPNNLIINGTLDLSGCQKIKTLPKNLIIKESLNLRETNITSLPSNIKIGKDLDLMASKIRKLPNNFHINGSLYLNNCKAIKNLPTGLIVENDLDLTSLNITEIPKDIKIGNNLDLTHSKIENIPDGLVISENLYLNNLIKKLPDNLKCKTIYTIPRDKSIPLIGIDVQFESIVMNHIHYSKKSFFEKFNKHKSLNINIK